MQAIASHPFGLAVEWLQPGIVFVRALEGELEPKSRGKRSRKRRLAGADHPGDAEKHGLLDARR
jgi:hypothetical protein